ncbi:chemerin-like receptor 1 [Carettochelys insculpta]|uniref:chemerin-like receptor 1 n=1 Tax=Carettochelys insculpta TaxID=44489 RepID=UPI003EBABB7D
MADNASFSYDYDGDYEAEASSEASTRLRGTMHVVSMVIYSIAFVLGVMGNGLVIFITGFRMRRTVNTIWFLNLAVADFVFTSFLPLSVAYVALGFHWPFGQALCKINTAVAFLNMFTSVFLLTIISADRCVAVAWPVWAQNHRSPRLASLVAFAAWLAALALSCPYAVFRDTRRSPFQENITHCYNNYALSRGFQGEELAGLQESRHWAMVLTRFAAGFVVPFAVIVACYVVIAAKMRRNRLARSGRPYRIMVAVVAAFFFCWLPYHIFSFLEVSVTAVTPQVQWLLEVGTPLASGLACLNSCLNPLLYVFVGRDFREQLRSSVLLAFESAFSEVSSQSSLPVTQGKARTEWLLVGRGPGGLGGKVCRAFPL